ATSSSVSMSRRTCSRKLGRCTLTATSRPSRSAAPRTWPSDAAASGARSKRENAFDSRTPSSSLTIRSTSSNGNGSTSSCRRGGGRGGCGGGGGGSARKRIRGEECGAREQQPPDLDECRTQPLEIRRERVTGRTALVVVAVG